MTEAYEAIQFETNQMYHDADKKGNNDEDQKEQHRQAIDKHLKLCVH